MWLIIREFGLLLFVRIILVGFAFIVLSDDVAHAAAAGGGASVPATCSPVIWDNFKNRAWEEGQREITQNQNLIARPDSVLSMTCFDQFANHFSKYGSEHFPSSPDHSLGNLGGAITLAIIAADGAAYDAGGAAAYTGYVTYAAIELLVLDQLMSGVTSAATQALDAGDLAPCDGKEYYIEDNFPELMIGDRAIDYNGYDEIPTLDGGGGALSTYDGCERMNDVWIRSKCYDFASEKDHDFFFNLEDYSTSDDYRTKEEQCSSPKEDGSPDLPTDAELDCDVTVHSIPGSWSNASLADFFDGNVVPTWSTASAAAIASGDDYITYLNLRDSNNCSSLDPLKTGYIVSDNDGNQYVDAVCPAPGCYFDPPSSLSGTGSCN